MKKKILISLIVILFLVAGGIFSYFKFFQKKPEEAKKEAPQVEKEPEWKINLDSHFGFMPASFDYESASEAGGYFDRPFFELFSWGEIEKEKGTYDFSLTDEKVKEVQENGLHILANIQTFSPWDNAKPEEKIIKDKEEGPAPSPSRKPNDMDAYKNFVRKLTERYDDDSTDDMPGLKYPIYFWEVLNEPEMQQPPLAFFDGPPEDYFEVLKITYETIKETSPEAFVLHAGMAGTESWMTEYWDKVFGLGAADYFDIANMHCIGHGEHLNIPVFKEFLAKYNIQKPIWITEVQIEDRKDKKTKEEYAASLVRSYAFGLANGAEKFFYVNLKLPEEGLPTESEGGPGFSDLSTLIATDDSKNPLFYAHKNIVDKIGKFSRVEKIKEKVEGKIITEGQYKFTIDNKTIYVLWGKGDLPEETKVLGPTKVTDFLGKEIESGNQVKLSSNPIFIEIE